MLDYSKYCQPKKIGSKRVKLNTKKNKKLYKQFIELVILLCIILSFVTLVYSIGNIIAIVTYNHVVITSNVFLNISNTIFDNLSSIFAILIVTVFCKEKKGILITFLGLLIFFAVQDSFIKSENNQIVILYFFKVTNLFLFKNIGINSLNMGSIGGIFFGLFCSYIINKLYNQRFSKTFAFLNGMPIIMISLFIFIFCYALVFLLFYIFIIYITFKLHELAIIIHDASFYNFLYNLLNVILSPLGNSYFTPSGFSKFLIHVFFADNLCDTTQLIMKFQNICLCLGFHFNYLYSSWNDTIIQDAWNYLHSIKIDSSLSLNQWILLLPFNSLPTSTNGHFVNLFDWFNQARAGGDYSIIFGFFIALGSVLILTAKKENLKSTIFMVSFMSLMVILTGKTYTLSLMLLFVSPVLYFGLYLPIVLFINILINLLDIHLVSIVGMGLIDFITFGIIPLTKGTNFAWVFLFSFICFAVSGPILYFIIIKKNLPFIGRTEILIPRLTHRQIHEFFNH